MTILDDLYAQATTQPSTQQTNPMAMLSLMLQLGALGSSAGVGQGATFGGGFGGAMPSGGLKSWIDQAEAAAGVNGGPFMDRMLNILVQHESGGNPSIVNKTPTPGGYHAEGLAQMIAPTFQHYMLPGMGNIDNPVDNLAAAIRYMIDRYGSVRQTPGIASVLAGHGYQPY